MTEPTSPAAPRGDAPMPSAQPPEPSPEPSPERSPERPSGRPRRPAPRTAEVERILRRDFDVVIEGEPMRLPLAEAILLQLAHRALRGEVWALKEMLRQMAAAERTRALQDAAHAQREINRARNNAAIRERRRMEAEEQAEAEYEAELLTPPKFKSPWNPATTTERALRHLGAAVEGPMHEYAGETGPGDTILQRWVVDAAVARDPSLLEGLERDQWRDIRVAIGEPHAGGAPFIPPWPKPIGEPPFG